MFRKWSNFVPGVSSAACCLRLLLLNLCRVIFPARFFLQKCHSNTSLQAKLWYDRMPLATKKVCEKETKTFFPQVSSVFVVMVCVGLGLWNARWTKRQFSIFVALYSFCHCYQELLIFKAIVQHFPEIFQELDEKIRICSTFMYYVILTTPGQRFYLSVQLFLTLHVFCLEIFYLCIYFFVNHCLYISTSLQNSGNLDDFDWIECGAREAVSLAWHKDWRSEENS